MTIYIVGLEEHEQRYTGEWAVHLPTQIQRALPQQQIRVIEGRASRQVTTPGAFLNFAATNIFKSQQIAEISTLFKSGAIKAGDAFLFTDAWHYGIIATRYMSDLLNIPVRQISLWHAGQYDPHDFLGRISDRTWAYHFEQAIFAACDMNVFATQFHIDLFKANHGDVDDRRIQRAGWPMEYLNDVLRPYRDMDKCNLILFPHRLAPEKQVDIFRDLAGEFPDYEFRVCQDEKLAKADYHHLLGQAKMVFSASLQETLGIGCYEGLVCGAIPLAPHRLSYAEMYPDPLLYPSEWTFDWSSYQQHKGDLIERIKQALWFQENCLPKLLQAVSNVSERFFHGNRLYELLHSDPSFADIDDRPLLNVSL